VGGTATLIAVAYGVVTVVGVVLAILLATTTFGRKPPVDAEKLAHRERNWLYIVIVIMLTLLFATIWFTPYGQGGTNSHDVVVKVKARQFLWQLSRTTIPVGREIDFRLTSVDVNHGFGIYNPDNVLVAQAQVLPGRTQHLVHTFTKPGHYQVLCLEFCGFGHAAMQARFTVVGR